MAEAFEALRVFSQLMVGGATVTLAVFAWWALGNWRDEIKAGRKAAVAAEMLALLHEGRARLAAVRGDWIWRPEMGDRGIDPTERVKVSKDLNDTLDRFEAVRPFLADLDMKRHGFGAVLGPDADDAVREFLRLACKIKNAMDTCDTIDRRRHAAEERRDDWTEMTDDPVPDHSHHHVNDRDESNYEKLRRKWTAGGDDPEWGEDEVARRMDAIVARAEAFCRPAMEAGHRRS